MALRLCFGMSPLLSAHRRMLTSTRWVCTSGTPGTQAVPRSVLRNVSVEEFRSVTQDAVRKAGSDADLSEPFPIRYEGTDADLRPHVDSSRTEAPDRLRRRLRMQASKRGTAEMDYLIGGFVDTNIDQMSDSECFDLDVLLAEVDTDLTKWVMLKDEPPAYIRELSVWDRLMEFSRSRRDARLS
eukprot:TRINITY_DN22409_c0_g1_i1.p1 TRINITY_DN22409_c0_g1~~TRINITY_DN22409_c0_g1_i1.p1  ORF type:complete len:184 (-),score=3.38 TRINITY_DN22409_c0_g1_i1:165-716(-)